MAKILIIKEQQELAHLWERAVMRLGADVEIANCGQTALKMIQDQAFDIIVLDLDLSHNSAFGISDFVSYRWPKTRILFVTNGAFFSDGSIFQICANACGYVHGAIAPDDLAAMAYHYAGQFDNAALSCGAE